MVISMDPSTQHELTLDIVWETPSTVYSKFSSVRIIWSTWHSKKWVNPLAQFGPNSYTIGQPDQTCPFHFKYFRLARAAVEVHTPQGYMPKKKKKGHLKYIYR